MGGRVWDYMSFSKSAFHVVWMFIYPMSTKDFYNQKTTKFYFKNTNVVQFSWSVKLSNAPLMPLIFLNTKWVYTMPHKMCRSQKGFIFNLNLFLIIQVICVPSKKFNYRNVFLPVPPILHDFMPKFKLCIFLAFLCICLSLIFTFYVYASIYTSWISSIINYHQW